MLLPVIVFTPPIIPLKAVDMFLKGAPALAAGMLDNAVVIVFIRFVMGAFGVFTDEMLLKIVPIIPR